MPKKGAALSRQVVAQLYAEAKTTPGGIFVDANAEDSLASEAPLY
jgi:hypothetical protein